MDEIEDENEKYCSEISQLHSSLDKCRMECAELRAEVSETRLYKEREDQLLFEMASIKNELK